jgi:hypothetical protein
MGIGTYVSVGGVPKKCSKVWQKINGVWTRVVPSVIVDGVPKVCFQDYTWIYKDGVEFFPIEAGWTEGEGTQQKYATSLFLQTPEYSESLGIRTWIVTQLLDLTNYRKLCIEWFTDGPYFDPKLYFGVSQNNFARETGDFAAYQNTTVAASQNPTIQELDISSINGQHYVIVQARMSIHGMYPNIYWIGTWGTIYKLWLEPNI